MEVQFKVGDTVQLKSGGGYMIIHKFAANTEYVVCKWHDAQNKPHEDNFPVAGLKKIDL